MHVPQRTQSAAILFASGAAGVRSGASWDRTDDLPVCSGEGSPGYPPSGRHDTEKIVNILTCCAAVVRPGCIVDDRLRTRSLPGLHNPFHVLSTGHISCLERRWIRRSCLDSGRCDVQEKVRQSTDDSIMICCVGVIVYPGILRDGKRTGRSGVRPRESGSVWIRMNNEVHPVVAGKRERILLWPLR